MSRWQTSIVYKWQKVTDITDIINNWSIGMNSLQNIRPLHHVLHFTTITMRILGHFEFSEWFLGARASPSNMDEPLMTMGWCMYLTITGAFCKVVYVVTDTTSYIPSVFLTLSVTKAMLSLLWPDCKGFNFVLNYARCQFLLDMDCTVSFIWKPME
jgi:hypothetical protein